MAYVYNAVSQTDNGYYLFKFIEGGSEVVIAVRKPVYDGMTGEQKVAAYTALKGQIQLELLKALAGGSAVNANAATQSLTAANAVTIGTDDGDGTGTDNPTDGVYDIVTGEGVGTGTDTGPALQNNLDTA